MGIIEKAAGRIEQNQNDSKIPVLKKIVEIDSYITDKDGTSTVRSPTHVQYTSSESNQTILDLSRLRQMGGGTPNDERTQIAEEFRMIKRPLIKKAFHQGAGHIANGNLIMITSALAGEGKSFCAVNLALSIAMEMDHTVLLIDADVAHPSIPEFLGIKSQKGLLDILLDDKLELADVIMRSNIEKLSILTSGKKNRRATELLASQNMRMLLSDISKRYHDRIIIIDSPPLLLTTESPVLAAQMGQIVLVVEAETTTQHAVFEALRQIENCKNINLIFNKARYFSSSRYYHYNT